MWEAVQMSGAWLASRADGMYFRTGDDWDEAAARDWCLRANARAALERRKSAALDRAVATGVSEADIWKAITEDTLLQFEAQAGCADAPIIVSAKEPDHDRPYAP